MVVGLKMMVTILVDGKSSNDCSNFPIMKTHLLFLTCVLICLPSCALSREEEPPPFMPLRADDPKGLLLPAGVSRGVDTDGNVIDVDHQFTTPQYQRAAAHLLLEEVNRIAKDFSFPDEVLPITATNITKLHFYPFGFSYFLKSLGGLVCTSNYVYTVGHDNKFSGVVVANYDQVCLKLQKTRLPLEQLDTNAAYQLATQWLATVSIDVTGLNRDCKPHIAVSPFWNGLAKLGQQPKKEFAPIYYVWWTSPKNDTEHFGSAASVELFLPTKKIIQLYANDPKYVLRKPLVFTNLESLFPGTGSVTIFTNTPGPVYYPGSLQRR